MIECHQFENLGEASRPHKFSQLNNIYQPSLLCDAELHFAMFSADLSWTDETVEKVGERRERKERQRGSSISSSNSSSNGRRLSSRKPSISDKTSFTSITGSFWTPSFRKGRTGNLKKPNLAPIDSGKLPLDSPQHHKVLQIIPSPTPLSGVPLDKELPPWGNYPQTDDTTVCQDVASPGEFKAAAPAERRLSWSELGHRWATSANNDSNTFWSSYQQTAENVITLNGSRPETFLSNTSSTKVRIVEWKPRQSR